MGTAQQLILAGRGLVPTTWDPSQKGSGVSLSNGNLTATRTTSPSSVRSIAGVDIATGSAYWELLETIVGSTAFPGIVNATFPVTTQAVLDAANSWSYDSQGRIFSNGSLIATYSSYANGDRLSFAIKSGSLWVAKNGTWQNSGNPGAGTGAVVTGLTGTMYAGWSDNANGGIGTANFGATAFTYTVPSGFVPGLG